VQIPPGETETLIREIAAGRESALVRLIAVLGPGLARYAGRVLGSAADGDEVAQDVFVRIWREAGRFDPARGSVQAWAYRIATNLCIDRQRRARVRRFLGLGAGAGAGAEAAGEVADVAAGPERRLAGRERLAAVRQALDALPARQRMALLLAAVADFSGAEIASIMGVSRGSAEQLLVRARSGLRARLGE